MRLNDNQMYIMYLRIKLKSVFFITFVEYIILLTNIYNQIISYTIYLYIDIDLYIDDII